MWHSLLTKEIFYIKIIISAFWQITKQGNIMDKEKSGISFGDVLYILRKYWLVILAIIVASLAAGWAFFSIAGSDYSASVTLKVVADIGDRDKQYNEVVYTKYFVDDVAIFLKQGIVVDKAEEEAGIRISASAIKVASKENSLYLSVSYRASDKEDAKLALESIIKSAKSLSRVTGEDGKYKYFSGDVTINEVGTPVVSRVRTLSKCVMIAGLCGLVLSVAVALILYFANDRIASVERVEAITGKKNIMCINANGKKNRKNDKTLLPMNLEKLADTLVFLKEGDNDKVYQIQSSISEEGKSTVTANLAISLGRIGKKVLVIECDFRKPHVHKYMGLDRHVGMTDYFKDEKTFDEVVKPTAFENVSAITCGSTMDNPTLLFMSHKFETLVAEAREKYDFVILDCAPVGRVSDYISVSRVADSAILVVGCEKVSSQTLKNTVSELKEAGAAVLGTVFNFTSRSRHGYGYYYYSDYGEKKKDK